MSCARAGIYHIVSISGLHMVLAAGTFFWLARALLALVRPASPCSGRSRRSPRCTAMVGATAYCVFSGSDVATERSLIMTLVMFGAVLVGPPGVERSAISPIAALVVLAREPESAARPELPDVVRRRRGADRRSRRCCDRRRVARAARASLSSGPCAAVGGQRRRARRDDAGREPRDGAVQRPITSRPSTRSA